jgi:hypothetical protein
MPEYGSSNELQPPGAGLPDLERQILDLALKVGSFVMSDNRALRLFRREAELLCEFGEGDESYDPFQQIVIPRVIGIEDSSRNWSVMMVLDHLCQTNQDMLTATKALHEGIVPRGEVDVALYKPSPDIGFEVLDQYRELSAEYCLTIERLIETRGQLSAVARFRHPWFGLLNAHQWHCLAAFHQRIHRRQAQKIIAMLGVT